MEIDQLLENLGRDLGNIQGRPIHANREADKEQI